jgi:hypothetical protein
MRARTAVFSGILSVLLVAVVLVYWRHRDNLFIHGFAWDSQLDAVGVLPLTSEHKSSLADLVHEAPNDKAARERLLSGVRSAYRSFGIPAVRAKPGLFSARCPDGPAFAYHLDGEGWLFYAFVDVRGTTPVTLDESSGINLLRQ